MQKSKCGARVNTSTEFSPVSQKVIQLNRYRCHARHKRGYRTLPLVCRHLALGCEDWDRGLLAVKRTSDEVTRWTLTPDGSLKLFDLPQGEVLIPANDVAAGLNHGLKLSICDVEAEIAAIDLRAALNTKSLFLLFK